MDLERNAIPNVAVGERTGLPWENERQTLGCWFRTLAVILFTPRRAFSIMQQRGGMETPIFYSIYGLGLPVAAVTIVAVPVLVVFLLLLRGPGPLDNSSRAGMALPVAIAVLFLGAVCVFLTATIGSMVGAGILHLSLKLFRGASHSYETTFRVWSFACSSLAAFILIPSFCIYTVWLVIPIGAWLVALLIVGLAQAHEIPVNKAAKAVLLPFIPLATLALVEAIYLLTLPYLV